MSAIIKLHCSRCGKSLDKIGSQYDRELCNTCDLIKYFDRLAELAKKSDSNLPSSNKLSKSDNSRLR